MLDLRPAAASRSCAKLLIRVKSLTLDARSTNWLRPPMLTRRGFLTTVSGGCAGLLWTENRLVAMPRALQQPPPAPTSVNSFKADVTLRIGKVSFDVAKNRTIHTIGYSGTVPGPILRLRESVPITVDLFNDTDTPELAHWHGQLIPPDVDGAAEEKSMVVQAHGHLRYRFTPGPSGARFLHTHVAAGSDLQRGTYTGQFCFAYIEPRENPGAYDQEVFLATHEWEPFLSNGEEEEEEEQAAPMSAEEKADREASEKADKARPNGWEVGYRLFSINGKALGHGEPVRVREGQRVLFHFLNASATENIKLALPGHRFRVIALDGNAVPNPHEVDVLQLGTAERIDAVVEMKNPGVWILGTPMDDDRSNGMGIVVEYADKTGAPRWQAPPKSRWDYTQSGANQPAPKPDQIIPMAFGKINGGKGGFNRWTINGKGFHEQGAPTELKKGLRYRLAFHNKTDDAHPVHLHRNIFELTSVDGKPTSGVKKDVVVVRGFGRVDVDFTADQPGLTLFHCHQQMHMDYGFMQLFNVV
jgi:FtsP/CotA-like multicopper oxidase with cupredoxin domain